jgi:hypothetical protein
MNLLTKITNYFNAKKEIKYCRSDNAGFRGFFFESKKYGKPQKDEECISIEKKRGIIK